MKRDNPLLHCKSGRNYLIINQPADIAYFLRRKAIRAAAPNPDKAINLPVHNIALTVNGVHLLENLVLEDLAKARAYEFAFVMQPLKLQGATGSTVAPTAIR